MGKLFTTCFTDELIKIIEAMQTKGSMNSHMPESFKSNWFEWVHNSYEAKESECTLDVDGLWILNKPNHNNQRVKFFWRIEPNYCTAGQPCYSTDRIVEIFKNSEHKKSVLKLSKSEVCLEWFGFDGPTNTCWGLSQKPVHVTMYEEGIRISCIEMKRGWKKEFTKFIEDYYIWKKS
jgi:hypothetical protein